MSDDILFLNIKKAQNLHKVGQKLNEIIEDICLFYSIFTENHNNIPSKESLYECLFNTSLDFEKHREKYSEIYSLLQDNKYHDFFNFLFEALEDPPTDWWKQKQLLLNNNFKSQR